MDCLSETKREGSPLRSKILVCTVIAATFIGSMPVSAAKADYGYQTVSAAAYFKPRAKVVTIRNNSGGNVARFAIRTANFRRDGTNVRFAGRCDSACTLFLGLPKSQVCLSPGATFRFHAPSARSARTVHATKRFMLAKYPGWVRNWISANGGLTRQLKTMDYGYASNFIKQC